MSSHKFYTLLSAAQDEIAGYHKYLRQTRKNRGNLLRLLDHIRKANRKSDEEKKQELDIALCCQVVYGEVTDANYKSILNMMSELHLLLKEYLLSERMKKGGLESRSLWLSILSEKGLEKEFSKQALMDIHEYENKPKKSIVDYLSLLLLQQQYYYHFTNNSAEDGIIQIQKTVEALNAYVQVLKLRMLCEVRHLKTVLPDECLIAHLIETLNTHNFSNVIDSPLPTLYNELRLLLETNDFKQFDKFTSLISKNAQKINAKELDEFLLFINSFLSTISRKSQTSEEMDKTHELNKIALRNKIFFLQGTMRVAHFLNIVTAACKVKDFKWVVHFAASCKYLLPASDREDAFALAMGITHFEKKEYHLLYDLVKNIESKEIYIQIRVRSLLVVCHYELDTDMDLKEYSMNFKAYLKRNLKLKPYKETVHSILNMVDIVKLLILENTPKQQIEDQINSCGSLTFKEWLIDKVKKYKKR